MFETGELAQALGVEPADGGVAVPQDDAGAAPLSIENRLN
jgi:hypothetical protein